MIKYRLGFKGFPPWLAQVGANLETRQRPMQMSLFLLSTLACPSGSEFGYEIATLFQSSRSLLPRCIEGSRVWSPGDDFKHRATESD